MWEALGGTKDSFFLPLDRHFGDESLIILVELERDIDSADEIADGIFFWINIEEVVSAIEGHCIVDHLFELEGVVQLLLPRSHEVDKFR